MGYFLTSFLALTAIILLGALQNQSGSSFAEEVLQHQQQQSSKSTLQLLTFLPYTNTDEIEGKLCELAMRVAADSANARSDVLVDFHFDPLYKNDACSSTVIMQKFTDFRANFSANCTSDVAPSPLVLGPVCSNGCQSLGSTIHEYNSVEVAIACNSPLFVAKKANFRNLFRSTPTSFAYLLPRAALVKDIGKWKRIAIISDSGPLNKPDAVNFFNVMTTQYGVDVFLFDVVNDVTSDYVNSVAQQRPRVIFIFMAKTNFAYFICYAYQAGMLGPRFVFVASQVFIVPIDYADRPSDCSDVMFQAQLKITIWAGTMFTVTNATASTTWLGYNYDYFEDRFDAYWNASGHQSFVTLSQRHRCHDIMLQAIVVLNDTDTQLRAQGSSLLMALKTDIAGDFDLTPSNLSKVTRNATASVDFYGLRGRYKYNSDQEIDDSLEIVQLINGVRQQAFFCKGGMCTQTGGIVWYTFNREPPSDGPREYVAASETPPGAYAAIFTIAFSLAGLEVTGFAAIWILRNDRQVRRSLPLSNCLLILGCIILCPTAILESYNFAWTSAEAISNICLSRTILLCVGYALIDGVVFAKLWRLYQTAHQPELRRSRKHDVIAIVVCLGSVAVCCLHNMAWFIANPLEAYIHNTTTFYADIDVISHVWYWECTSDNIIYWWVSLLVVHVATLLLASLMAVEANRHRNIRSVITDQTQMRIIAYNQLALLVVLVAVNVLVSPEPNRRLVAAGVELFVSTSNLVILYSAKLQPYLVRVVLKCTAARPHVHPMIQMRVRSAAAMADVVLAAELGNQAAMIEADVGPGESGFFGRGRRSRGYEGPALSLLAPLVPREDVDRRGLRTAPPAVATNVSSNFWIGTGDKKPTKSGVSLRSTLITANSKQLTSTISRPRSYSDTVSSISSKPVTSAAAVPTDDTENDAEVNQPDGKTDAKSVAIAVIPKMVIDGLGIQHALNANGSETSF